VVEKKLIGDRKHSMGLSIRQDPCIWANGPTQCGGYLLASLLVAALLAERRVLARRGWAGENRGLFEHPEVIVPSVAYGRCIRRFVHKPSFSAAC
jgi:hypothetical protein